MKLATQSEIRHNTSVIQPEPSSVSEVMNLIHAERETGTLTVRYNQGGVTSISFEQFKKVTQKELDEWDDVRNSNGHLATRGEISVLG